MATPDEIRDWMRANNLTQAELAAMCHTSRVSINRTLKGKTASKTLMSHIEMLMQSSRQLTLQLSESTEVFLRASAQEAGMSVEAFTERLLLEALVERALRAPARGRMVTPEDGLEAAEDSPDA